MSRTITKFSELGLKKRKSANEVLNLKPKERTAAHIEVVFVVDTTISMESFITEAKMEIVKILTRLERDVRIGVCLIEYRDHPPQDNSYATKTHDFMTKQNFEALLGRVTVNGGGDFAEAVLDGLAAINRLSWTAELRLVFLVGDAPAHGIYSTGSDTWPQGCPCGLTLESIGMIVRTAKVEFHAIALHEACEQCFRAIADACGGTSTTFANAQLAINAHIVPLLEEMAKRFLLQQGKSSPTN